MKQKNDKFNPIPKAGVTFIAIIIAICSIFVMQENLPVAIVILVCSLIILLEKIIWHFHRIKKMKEYISDAASDENELQNNEALFKAMSPIAGIRVDGTIAWYNSAFREMFPLVSGKKISDLIPEIKIREIYDSSDLAPITAKIGENTYKIMASVKRRTSPDHAAIMLYFENVTEILNLGNLLEEAKGVVAHIMVDNFDEAVDGITDEERLDVITLLDKNILGWVQDEGGIAKKIEKDKYLCIFTRKELATFAERKFDILKTIKAFNPTAKTLPTISVGIGVGGTSLLKNEISARKALDMALGRGGDQVVIRENGKFRYFGGNSKETEKRTKVKARIMAHNLRELIQSADNVLIMGHRESDADAIGAAIGIASLASFSKKEAKIILSKRDDTVNQLLKKIEENHYHDDMFIGKSGVKEYITPKTLLVICDTHIPEYTEMPELIETIKTKVVIDHHRRSESFISNADLMYHEPFASSACEMVTEIMQYFANHYAVSTVDAEALYLGMAVDTKNFTFKTGVRTFEAAAYLRGAGVDTLHVKKLLRKTIDNHKLKAAIVTETQLYNDDIAISLYSGAAAHIVIASAADEMLEINGVKASFVVARCEDNTVAISGRSLGEINVQVILEKLGGGGHMMVAGAQLEGTSVSDAGDMLKKAIDETLNENMEGRE